MSIIYLICLVAGLTFSVLTVLAGHFFGHVGHVDGSAGHAEAGADSSDAPGISVFSPIILATFITAFGAFGIILSQFPATDHVIISAPLSVAGGLLIASAMMIFFRYVFSHTQSSSESHVSRLVGAEANIITPIPENGTGEIAYVVGGTRYTAPARSDKGTAIDNGRTVKIVRVVGTQFYVSSL